MDNDKGDAGATVEECMKVIYEVEEIKELLGKLKVSFQRRMGLRNLWKKILEIYMLFLQIPEFRDPKLIIYPLADILTSATIATICGANTWDSIADFLHNHRKFFKRFSKYVEKKHGYIEDIYGFLPFTRSVNTIKRNKSNALDRKFMKRDAKGALYNAPCADTYARVFKKLDGDILSKKLAAFAEEKFDKIAKYLNCDTNGIIHYAFDGKRAGKNGGLILTLYNASKGICIRSELVDKKTNEIPVIQKTIGEMIKENNNSLAGFGFTGDALHCQHQTFNLIAKAGAYFSVQVKKNQKSLYNLCRNIYEDGITDLIREDGYYTETIDLPGSSEVTRRYNICPFSESISSVTELYESSDNKEELKNILALWPFIKAIVRVEHETLSYKTGKKSTEIRYYIVNYEDIELAASFIRKHWMVESLHWLMDTACLEDKRRTRTPETARNIGIIIKFALFILRFSTHLMRTEKKPKSIANVMFNLNSDLDNLSVVLALHDEDFLKSMAMHLRACAS